MKKAIKILLILLISITLYSCQKSQEFILEKLVIEQINENTVSWTKDVNAVEYEIDINGIINITTNNEYVFIKDGNYEIKVRSIADRQSLYKNSPWSELFNLEVQLIKIEGVIVLEDVSINLKFSETYLIIPTLLPTKLNSKVLYESDDDDIVTVENGLVTAIGLGTAIIKVSTDKYQSAYLQVVVKPSVTVNNGLSIEIEEKEILSLNTVISPTPNSNVVIRYESSDTSVLFVGPTGIINAIKPGLAVVTITTSNGGSQQVEVTVTEIVPAEIMLTVIIPSNSYPDFEVYLVGSFNDWAIKDINYKLVQDSENPFKFSLLIKTIEAKSYIEYKYILSTSEGYAWESYQNSPTANRMFYVTSGPSNVSDVIERWQEFN